MAYRHLIFYIASLAAIATLWSEPAYAYLDPGTGSLILSTILGGVAGAMVIAKMTWNNILVFLRIRKPDDDETVSADHTKPDA